MTDGTAETLSADYAGIRPAHEEAADAERQRNIRRTIVGVAVFLLHVIAIAVFVYSSRIPLVQRVRETIPEAITWIQFPHPAPPKKIEAPLPEEPLPQLTAPITLPPIQSRPIAPLAPPEAGGLLGVGRSLACGASSYEYLSPMQREQCIRHPWHFVRRPDGTIVLDVPKPEAPPAFTGGDIMRHEQQTAPPCPVLQNVPCLGKILPNHDPVTNGSQQ